MGEGERVCVVTSSGRHCWKSGSHLLRALEGKRYGHAKYFLRRPKRVDEPQSPTSTIAPSVVSPEWEGAE